VDTNTGNILMVAKFGFDWKEEYVSRQFVELIEFFNK
jgi:hypothetical protein